MASSNHAIINIENEPTETIGWQYGTDELEVIYKCLPAIPDECNLLAADATRGACRCDANDVQHF